MFKFRFYPADQYKNNFLYSLILLDSFPNMQNHNSVSYEAIRLPFVVFQIGAVDADTSMSQPQMDPFGIEYSLTVYLIWERKSIIILSGVE